VFAPRLPWRAAVVVCREDDAREARGLGEVIFPS
jgi:hypothetical protein